mgnify:CR=1 FL=1
MRLVRLLSEQTTMPNIRLPHLTCTRCAHTWVPCKPTVYVCPACHSPRWAEPKGEKQRIYICPACSCTIPAGT